VTVEDLAFLLLVSILLLLPLVSPLDSNLASFFAIV
jgi:hypothetical protein